jgi:hypothetical protein
MSEGIPLHQNIGFRHHVAAWDATEVFTDVIQKERHGTQKSVVPVC